MNQPDRFTGRPPSMTTLSSLFVANVLTGVAVDDGVAADTLEVRFTCRIRRVVADQAAKYITECRSMCGDQSVSRLTRAPTSTAILTNARVLTVRMLVKTIHTYAKLRKVSASH